MAKSGFAKDQLRSFIDRIERLNEERDALSADTREVYAEAKGTGFDTKIMRQVIRMRKLDKADFQEQEAMLDLYLTAMDMRDAPLMEYADRHLDPKLVERVAQAVQTPAGRGALVAAVDIMLANEEAEESQAKVDVEATPTEPNGVAEGQPEAQAEGSDGAELAGRLGARRSAPATSERMDETGGERAAPMEIPAFLLREKPPPKTVPA